MTASVVYFIRSFGCNVPFWDDWEMVPALSGRVPVTFAFLWEQHSEHRILLPKLIYLGLARLTHGLCAGMYLNGGALAVLAAGLILAMRRLRGRTMFVDAFFPLALLHWGHWENLLWCFQIQFVVSTFLVGVLFFVVLRSDGPLTLWNSLVAGLCLVGLPLCGAQGLPFVPLLACWLVYWGFRQRRSPDGSGRRLFFLSLAVAAIAVALVGLYFRGYMRPFYHPLPPGAKANLDMARAFLVMAWGSGAVRFWPYSGYAAAILLVAVLGALAVGWCTRPEQRVRTAGLAAFLGAVAALALAVGWGRSGLGLGLQAGFSFRYSALAAPFLCAIFVFGETIGASRLSRVLQMMLFLLAIGLLPVNERKGLALGRERSALLKAVEHDVKAGMPPTVLVERHPDVFPTYLACRVLLAEEGSSLARSEQRLALMKAVKQELRAGPAMSAPTERQPALSEEIFVPYLEMLGAAGIGRFALMSRAAVWGEPDIPFRTGTPVRN
jgi:hypothetical protein